MIPAIRASGEGRFPAESYLESLYPELQFGWAALRGLRTNRWKLIVGAERELYELATDSRELDDVAERHPARERELGAGLAEITHDSREPSGQRLEPDARTERELAALGYLTLSDSVRAEMTSRRRDPRERIGIKRMLDDAASAMARGEAAEAIRAYESIRELDPGNFALLAQLGDLNRLAGRLDGARKAY